MIETIIKRFRRNEMFGDTIDLTEYFTDGGEYIEIGPLDNPKLKKDECNVYYLDYRSTDEIKEVYKNSYAILDSIVNIDYATGNRTYRETVGTKKFDAVYSSHCIEHTFDIIGHLNDVCSILKENGRYVLVIPDCENSFDLFRQPTTFREAYSVFKGGSVIPFVADSIINTKPYYNKEDVKLFWGKEVSLTLELCSEEPRLRDFIEVHKKKQADVLNQGSYHIWTFSKISILEIIRDSLRLGLIQFELERFEPISNENNYNMYLVLKKNSELANNYSRRLAQILKCQLIIEKYRGFRNKLYDLISGSCSTTRLYIYGAGVLGRNLYGALSELYKGSIEFVVTDGQTIDDDVKEKTVFLSSLNNGDDTLVIIGTANREIYKDMEENLAKRGFEKNINYIAM